jgi:hypothetical protein
LSYQFVDFVILRSGFQCGRLISGRQTTPGLEPRNP